ncbi:MAG: NAD(P)-binding protein [Spirochaetes bacterium]|nr:NAD(P)-binding protein [Spirochaetota bacterium]
MPKNVVDSTQDHHFDAIIIGSGLSGLSSAGLLTKVNKKRVLVLEKHYEMGGLTHEFKRGPYSWDIGLHYVGNIKQRLLDYTGYMLFRFLTEGKLKWNKMPDEFEAFIFPDFKVKVKQKLKGYKKSLLKQFPDEKKVINRYIHDIHMIRLWYILQFFSKFLHSPLKQLCLAVSKPMNKKALMTTAEYLNSYIKNDRLKAVLVSRWGNYGIPPTESAFAIHAVIEHHYYSGGIFPEGGAEKIAVYMEKTIETYGGKILVNRKVEKILIKENKAYGVEVRDLSKSEQPVSQYYAPLIISAAGARNTYLKLIPKEIDLPIKEKLANMFPGYGAINLYLGLKESPEKFGIKGENYWIFENYDLDMFHHSHFSKDQKQAGFCFLSFPSLKSKKPGAHTADVITMLPKEFFDKWKDEYWKERHGDYYQLKEQLTQSLLELIERNIPGFSELIAYKEMATPLTFEHFTSQINGTFYGLPETPERYKIKELDIKTPIKNLYLTGTDILCNGILPALLSGMGTVSYINGFFGIMKVMGKVFAFSPEKAKKAITSKEVVESHLSSEDKKLAILVKKVNVSHNLIELTYRFAENLNFIPGQHVKLLVGDAEWRAYSVAKTEHNHLVLVIDTRPDGVGSRYAKAIEVGDSSLFRLPISDLIYHQTDRDLIFIATGTGLIPFLHMLDELKQINFSKNIKLIFGCMNENDNFTNNYISPYLKSLHLESIVCVENSTNSSDHYCGRVTDYLSQNIQSYKHYDFYLCGHPHMTEATVKQLRNNGADHIYY